MKMVPVRAGRYISITYKTPRRRLVEFKVIANDPVHTYVLNDRGLRDLEEGRPLSSYGGFESQTFHHQVLELYDLRGGDAWHLVIYNPQPEPTKVYYEVMQ